MHGGEKYNINADNNEDQDTCVSCGGRRCKRRAGALFPSDIKGPMYKGLVESLTTGMYLDRLVPTKIP